MDIIVDSWAWLPKAELTDLQIKALKLNLTVHPRKVGDHPGEPPGPIELFVERGDKIGIPREYFLANRKPGHRYTLNLSEGGEWPSPLKFGGTLRPEQERALAEVTAKLNSGTTLGGIVRASPGWGKSLRYGTLTLMYDGSIIPVEQVVPGDLLMGPDSRPRKVISTSKGYGPLYKITPIVGKPWVCNDVHILTLVHSLTSEIHDVAIQDYLALPESSGKKPCKHYLKQFSPPDGVDFQPHPAPILDPYFLGVWYGDGSKYMTEERSNGVAISERLKGVAITKPDPEIRAICEELAKKFGLHVTESMSGGSDCPTYHIVGRSGKPNPLLDVLRGVVEDGAALPRSCLLGSREVRKQFFAGLLDTDGYHNNGCYEISQKRAQWAEDIAFLARSLGIRATVKPKTVEGQIYWMVKLAGDFGDLPLRIPRKMPRKRLQKKIATRTGFKVEPAGEGWYAGFILDEDGRYLMGDFTVTHNTVAACALIADLAKPTLVVVHKEFLVNQWQERLEQFLPGVKIGRAQQDQCDYQGKHVVIGMVHSLASRAYSKDFYSWPSLLIVDECHRIGAETWSAVPAKFPTQYRLGFSATPKRIDGADNAFLYHIGQVLFSSSEQRMKPLIKRVKTDFKLVSSGRTNFALASKALLLQFVCNSDPRNRLINDLLLKALAAGRKVMVLSERLLHLRTMEANLRKTWSGEKPITTGFYIGGMTENQLERSTHAQCIFATSQLASEGLDIPALDTLFLTTPLGNVEQACGRILRPCEGKKEPIVVDFRDDNVGKFKAMAVYRDKLYARIT
jgi:superfamily II DNA or RNA helicase